MRIEDLEALVERQRQERALEAGYVTSRDARGNVTFHRQPSIQERIYTAVQDAGGGVTRADIARAVGLKKTPHLIALIEGMVTDGLLHRVQDYWRNGVVMYRYEVKK